MAESQETNSPALPVGHNFTSTLHSDTYPDIDPTKANLHGKAVLITGASKGLGRAISVSFARAGASHIAICARSNLSSVHNALQDAAAAASKDPPQVLQLELDVSSQQSVENAAAQVENRFGRLDILVNNAGVLETMKSITESDPDHWWNTWIVNVRGPYLMTRAFLPLLLRGGEKQIINVSSVGAFIVMPNLSAYQPSKLAVLRFSDFVDAEYRDQGVLVYSVHPGSVPTDMVGGDSFPKNLRHLFNDTPELAGDSIIHLVKERKEWLAGRFISCNWDMPELERMKESIVSGNKLKITMSV